MRGKVNIGILGYANIAKKAIIPTLLEMKDSFQIKAIGTSSFDKFDLIKNEVKGIEVVNYQSIIEDSTIHAVYIPLPNALHYPWIEAALKANKHVLCEKSLACSVEEVKLLCELAKEKNLCLLENFQFRKHEQLQVIKDLIDKGEIGDLRFIRSSFCFPPFPDADNIRYKKELGGGALLDAGAYPLKLASELFGKDIHLKDASLHFEDKEVDIWGNGTIYSQTSIPLQFSFGFDQQYQCNIEVIGSKGKISTERIFTAPPNHEVTIHLQQNIKKRELRISPMNHYKAMLEHFVDCIENIRLRQEELEANKLQAKLISEFYQLSKIK